MSNRSKIIFSVTAILLIPILLGMTPIRMVQKIGDGCPFSKGKQILNCNPCPFHSITSQEDHGITDLPSMLFNEASIDLPGFDALSSHSITSNSPLSVVPLRC